MATNLGALKPVTGFTKYFKKHESGVHTNSKGEKQLMPGWSQDATTGAVSESKGALNWARRNPVKTGLIGGGVGIGGAYAYNSYTGGGGGADSFQRGAE